MKFICILLFFKMDLTLPGYKYVGPFNRLDKGIPSNATDAAAYEHDIAYSYYEFLGLNPYLYYNNADSILLFNIRGHYDYGAKLARGYFKLKALLMPKMENDPLPEKVISFSLKWTIYTYCVQSECNGCCCWFCSFVFTVIALCDTDYG